MGTVGQYRSVEVLRETVGVTSDRNKPGYRRSGEW